MAVLGFDHAGVVVEDLDAAVRFFDALGFVRVGSAEVGGPWVDRVLGLDGVRAELVVVSAPDGSGRLELSRFLDGGPADRPYAHLANAYGLRHIAYQVDDVDAVVTAAAAAGYGTVGEVVEYEDVYRLAYLRGPEGLIVEVAERLS